MSQRFPNERQVTLTNNGPGDVLEESKAFEESLARLRNWRERIVHILLVSTAIIGLFAVIAETIIVIPDRNWGVLAVIVAAYLVIVVLAVFRRIPYRIRAAAFLIIFYLIGLFDLAMSGLAGDGRVFMLAVPLLTLVLLGHKPGLAAGAISLLSIAAIGGLMSSEILPVTFNTVSTDIAGWISGIVIFLLIGAAVFSPTSYVLNQLIATLSGALEEAQRRWFEVRQLSRNLERQVGERTKELARRSEKLEAAVEVSREVASIRQIDEILDTTVHLISERFAFYHAGIFLVDESGTFALLRAVSSEGGRRMLERGHKLQVGREGIVGQVTATGRPRITLDVGEDAAFFDNPDLPYTRSEMALPLQIRDRVIGALDVQSTQEAAFSEEDIAILQTMADQIALAIENAQLLEQSERALRGLEAAYGEYAGAALEAIVGLPAFEYDRVDVNPTQPQANPDVDQVMKRGKPITSIKPDKGQSALVAPLRTRDERVIGAIALEEQRPDRAWTPEEIELVEAVSEQVAQALESASFYQMEQRRRRVSDTLREVTRVVGSTLDLDEVIDRLLDQLEALIHFNTASLQLIQEDRRELIGGRGFDLEEAQEHSDLLMPVSKDPLIAKAVETKQPVIIADVLEDPRWEMREDTAHVRSWLAAPLVIGEEVIVLLIADHPRPNTYDEETGELVSAVAAQAAIAVQNARLYNEAQQRVDELGMLFRASEALAGAPLRAEQIAEITVRQFVEVMDVPEASISILEPGTDTLNVLADVYKEDEEIKYESLESFRLEDYPATQRVMETQQLLVVQRSDPDADPAERAYMEEYNVQTLVIIPLAAKGEAIGVIELESWESERHYTADQLNLAVTMANQVAVALENARLFEETRQRAERERLISEITGKIRASTNLDTIIQIAAQELGQALGTARVLVRVGIDPDDQSSPSE